MKDVIIVEEDHNEFKKTKISLIMNDNNISSSLFKGDCECYFGNMVAANDDDDNNNNSAKQRIVRRRRVALILLLLLGIVATTIRKMSSLFHDKRAIFTTKTTTFFQQKKNSLSLLFMNKEKEDSSVPILSQQQRQRRKVQEQKYTKPIVPLFFMAGQSNMQGFSEQAAIFFEGNNPGKGEGHKLTTVIQALQQPNPTDWWDRTKELSLQREILRVDAPVANKTSAGTESRALIDLQGRYPQLFANGGNDPNGGILRPKANVYCSYLPVELSQTSIPVEIRTAQRLQPSLSRKDLDRCGEPWGLELTLGHTLNISSLLTMSRKYQQRQEQEYSYRLTDDEDFAMIKVGAGGTELYRDWSRFYNTCVEPNAWDANVVRRLKSITDAPQTLHPRCGGTTTDCQWMGIVWFQGENDTWQLSNANNYAAHLSRFLNYLREEMYHAKHYKSLYRSAVEIPIVVVGIGQWLTRDHSKGRTVLQAQKDFCESDPHAAFVNTDDLSPNMHFEAASMLVIGDRVARALESLLRKTQLKVPVPIAAAAVSSNEKVEVESLLRTAQLRVPVPIVVASAPSAAPSAAAPSSALSSNERDGIEALLREAQLTVLAAIITAAVAAAARAAAAAIGVARPSFEPSSGPSYSSILSNLPSVEPSASTLPSVFPAIADVPTVALSDTPSSEPSDTPSSQRSHAPSKVPSTSTVPTISDVPTVALSDTPSSEPSDIPSDVPSSEPSHAPSKVPSTSPTVIKTQAPTASPSDPIVCIVPDTESPTTEIPPTASPSVALSESIWDIIFKDGFEDGWGNFVEPIAKPSNNYDYVSTRKRGETASSTTINNNILDARRVNTRSHERSGWSIRLRRDTDMSILRTKVFTAGTFEEKYDDEINQYHPYYTQLRVSFWFLAVSMEETESFYLEMNTDGDGWNPVATYTSSREQQQQQQQQQTADNIFLFRNLDGWKKQTQIISLINYQPQLIRLRFRKSGNEKNDRIFIDDVTISGTLLMD